MDAATHHPGRISEAFASELRSGRAEFNAQFIEARRLYPELNGGVFLEFLRNQVDPIVRALEGSRPEDVAGVALAAYEAGLELVGQNLVGPGARNHGIEEGWRRVLIPVAELVGAAPARMISAVSNALHNLEATPGARPEQWITELARLGPQCGDPETFLRLGQLAAWRAGLAHFRQGAIAAAEGLPAALALGSLGVPAGRDWAEIRQRLLADPWFDPAAPPPTGQGESKRVRFMAQVGAFRGFGGLFVEPPRVAAAGDHFVVRSGQENWLLTADLFGATFHRTSPADFQSANDLSKLPDGLRIADSTLIWGEQRFEIPGLGKLTSAAANPSTLAVTWEFTHSVVLVALQ